MPVLSLAFDQRLFLELALKLTDFLFGFHVINELLLGEQFRSEHKLLILLHMRQDAVIHSKSRPSIKDKLSFKSRRAQAICLLEKAPSVLQKVALIYLFLAFYAVGQERLYDALMLLRQHISYLDSFILDKFCCLLKHHAFHVFEFLVELSFNLLQLFRQYLLKLLIADFTHVYGLHAAIPTS